MSFLPLKTDTETENLTSLKKNIILQKLHVCFGFLFCKIVLVSVVRAQELNPQNTWQHKFLRMTHAPWVNLSSLDIWDLMTNIGSSDLQEFGALGGSSGDQLFHQCKDASLGKTKDLPTWRRDEKFI